MRQLWLPLVHLIHSGMVIHRSGGPWAKVEWKGYAEDPMRPSGHLQAVIRCQDDDTTLRLLPTSAKVGHVHTRDPHRRLAPARIASIARTYPTALVGSQRSQKHWISSFELPQPQHGVRTGIPGMTALSLVGDPLQQAAVKRILPWLQAGFMGSHRYR